MADFSLQYVTRVCPELCQAEAQAVRDHVLDTWPADAVYPDVVKQAARSLFPYSASPAMPSGSDLTHSDKLERARKALVDAHSWLSRTALSDGMAMTQRDLSFLIRSIEQELMPDYERELREAYEPGVLPQDCAWGGEEDSSWT